MASLFAEINKGADITSGLKKVDKAEVKKAKAEGGPVAGTRTSGPLPTAVVKAEPKREGDKWFLEGMQNVEEPTMIKAEKMSESVYVSKCIKSSLCIEGKLNQVTVDGCKRFNVQVGEVISSIEMVNSSNVKLYLSGKVPNITVEKCEDMNVIVLPAGQKAMNDCKELRIVSSRVSGVNVIIVQEDGDEKEMSIPSQFISKIENGRLVTVPAESIGV